MTFYSQNTCPQFQRISLVLFLWDLYSVLCCRWERTSDIPGRTGCCTRAFHPTQALDWIVRASARVQAVWLLDQVAMAAVAVCLVSRNDSKPFLSPEGQPVGTEEGSDICLFFADQGHGNFNVGKIVYLSYKKSVICRECLVESCCLHVYPAIWSSCKMYLCVIKQIAVLPRVMDMTQLNLGWCLKKLLYFPGTWH